MPSVNYNQIVRPVAGVQAQRAAVDATSAAADGNMLVDAVAGKRICVLAACLIAAGDVNATFYTGAADTGTAITGPLALTAAGGFVVPAPTDANLAWLVTDPGEALTLHLDAAVQIGGFIVYFTEEA